MRTFCVLMIALTLAGGCAMIHPEPQHLVFPEVPEIKFHVCGNADRTIVMICMSEPDASALAKWMEKVKAFEEARNRLLNY